jgi:hypothetical protein
MTPEEQGLIDEIKKKHPQYRHRRTQRVLQQGRVHLSTSAIYGYLKATGASRGKAGNSLFNLLDLLFDYGSRV